MGKCYLALVGFFCVCLFFFLLVIADFPKFGLIFFFFNKTTDHGAGGHIRSTSGFPHYLQETSVVFLTHCLGNRGQVTFLSLGSFI